MSGAAVSVIVAINRNEKNFKNSLESVRNQTFRNLEVHVVDFEGSKGLKNSNAAINSGIRETSGKYLVILDAPDIWKPEKLEKQVELLEQNPDIGLVYCGGGLKGFVFKELVTRNFLQNSSAAMFRRDCISRIGTLDETLEITGSWDFFLKLSLYYKFLGIKDPLAMYETNFEKNSNPCETFKTSGFKILNKIFQLQDLSPKYLRLVNLAYAMRYRYIGKKYFDCDRHEKALGYFSEAFKRDLSVSFKSDILVFYLLSHYYCCRDKSGAKPQKTEPQ